MYTELGTGVAGFLVGAQDAEGIDVKHYEFKKRRNAITAMKNEIRLMNGYVKSEQLNATDDEDLIKELNRAYTFASMNQYGIELGFQSTLLSSLMKNIQHLPPSFKFIQFRKIELYLQQLKSFNDKMEVLLNKNRYIIHSIRLFKVRILKLQKQIKYKQMEKENNIDYYEFEEMVEKLKEPHKKKLQKIIVMRHILQQLILTNPRWMKSKKYVNMLIKLKPYLTWESFEKKLE